MVSLKMVQTLLRHARGIGDTFVYLTYDVHLDGIKGNICILISCFLFYF